MKVIVHKCMDPLCDVCGRQLEAMFKANGVGPRGARPRFFEAGMDVGLGGRFVVGMNTRRRP